MQVVDKGTLAVGLVRAVDMSNQQSITVLTQRKLHARIADFVQRKLIHR